MAFHSNNFLEKEKSPVCTSKATDGAGGSMRSGMMQFRSYVLAPVPAQLGRCPRAPVRNDPANNRKTPKTSGQNMVIMACVVQLFTVCSILRRNLKFGWSKHTLYMAQQDQRRTHAHNHSASVSGVLGCCRTTDRTGKMTRRKCRDGFSHLFQRTSRGGGGSTLLDRCSDLNCRRLIRPCRPRNLYCRVGVKAIKFFVWKKKITWSSMVWLWSLRIFFHLATFIDGKRHFDIIIYCWPYSFQRKKRKNWWRKSLTHSRTSAPPRLLLR